MSIHTAASEKIRTRPIAYVDRTYTNWRTAVDTICWRMTGCGLDDLPDANTRDMYDHGDSPAQAARHIVRNAF